VQAKNKHTPSKNKGTEVTVQYLPSALTQPPRNIKLRQIAPFHFHLCLKAYCSYEKCFLVQASNLALAPFYN
jgi:hypothetical protein